MKSHGKHQEHTHTHNCVVPSSYQFGWLVGGCCCVCICDGRSFRWRSYRCCNQNTPNQSKKYHSGNERNTASIYILLRRCSVVSVSSLPWFKFSCAHAPRKRIRLFPCLWWFGFWERQTQTRPAIDDYVTSKTPVV